MANRVVLDVLTIMRRALGRKNVNDPDSSDTILLEYLNDFIYTIMPNDLKLYENFSTLSFTIDQNTTSKKGLAEGIVDGIISFQDACAQNGVLFDNLSQECYIAQFAPEFNSLSWNFLPIFQDPGQFFMMWGINNEQVLIPGYPTNLLYYGNNFTFRTIPDQEYIVNIYGYTINQDFTANDQPLPYDYWLRYTAYGASVNYARDFRYEPQARGLIEATFKSERKQMMNHAHNYYKQARAMPRF